MALVAGTPAFTLTVNLIDAGGNISTKNYDLTSADATEAATDVSVVLNRIGLVTDAVVKSYSINQVFVEDALTLPANVEIENRASLVLQILDNPLKKARHEIPAPKIGLFMGATGTARNIVDVADTDLLSYLGIFGTGRECTISDGETIENPVGGGGLVSGKRIHVASRKG